MRCTGLAAERGGYFSVRVRELDGEMQPWVDLLRTHSLVPRVGADTPDGGPNIQPYHALRPIPRTQMDGTTCCYTQNPGTENVRRSSTAPDGPRSERRGAGRRSHGFGPDHSPHTSQNPKTHHQLPQPSPPQ